MNIIFREKYLPLLFVSATKAEAKSLLSLFKKEESKYCHDKYLIQLENKKVYLIITGIGFLIGTNIFAQYLNEIKPKLVINFGICGTLNSATSLNQNLLIEVTAISPDKEINLRKNYTKYYLFQIKNLPKSSLLTVVNPVLNGITRDHLFQKTGYQLVDMEGYFIADVCNKNNIPLWMLKHNTDFADKNANNFVRDYQAHWQELLAEGLFNLLIPMLKK